jgi:hypothetical protein
MVLAAAELALAQADMVAQTMPDTCVIIRPATTSSATGGWTDGSPTPVTTAPCGLRPVTERMRQFGGELLAEAALLITLPAEADVRGGDTITVGTNVYLVSGVLRGGTDELVRQVTVTETPGVVT